MTKHEAASIVAIITAAHPQWPASRETVALYVDALLDLDYPETLEAVRAILYSEERWPTIATIRRRTALRSGALAPAPGEAWGQIRSLISAGSADLEDIHPAIRETISRIGWWELVHSTNPETIRAQFLRLYAEAQRASDEETLTRPGAIALNARPDDRRRTDLALAAAESPSA